MSRKLRVLIVEDEVFIARNMAAELEKLGIEILGPVATGELAVETTVAEKPDLIIMDIKLAGKMTGIDAAVKIKEVRSTPVIFLTGYATDYIREQAEKVDCIEFFEKPVSIDQLKPSLEIFQNNLR